MHNIGSKDSEAKVSTQCDTYLDWRQLHLYKYTESIEHDLEVKVIIKISGKEFSS